MIHYKPKGRKDAGRPKKGWTLEQNTAYGLICEGDNKIKLIENFLPFLTLKLWVEVTKLVSTVISAKTNI